MCPPSVGGSPSNAGTAACNARVYNRYVFSTIPRGQPGDLREYARASPYVNRDSNTSVPGNPNICRRCSTGCRGADPTLRKRHRAKRETGWLWKVSSTRDGIRGRRYSKRAGIRLERGCFVLGKDLHVRDESRALRASRGSCLKNTLQ